MITQTLSQEEQTVVLAQLKAASPRIEFFIGAGDEKKSYTKQEMIEHVKNLDEVGKEFIKTQMNPLHISNLIASRYKVRYPFVV